MILFLPEPPQYKKIKIFMASCKKKVLGSFGKYVPISPASIQGVNLHLMVKLFNPFLGLPL